MRTLQPGSTGQDVEALQEVLKRSGYYGGKVDGIYGKLTQAAVDRFKIVVGIVEEHCGPETWDAIEAASIALGDRFQFLPPYRPLISRQRTEEILQHHDLSLDHERVVVVGIRGYFHTMGIDHRNDRAIYDDAIVVISSDKHVTFNANTDPSRYRKGEGTGSRKGMACLKFGRWSYQLGMHRGSYQALVQAAPVSVIRDGQRGDYEHVGWHGINIHRGGDGTTSSLGCQTIPPMQWPEFIALVRDLMRRHDKKTITYLLVEQKKEKIA